MNKNRTAGVLLIVTAALVTGCDHRITPPAPVPNQLPDNHEPPAPSFNVADVTLSGIVYEVTSAGRVPVAGALVLNGEGEADTTDENGFYSIRPIWVCPCAGQPSVPAGTTFVWVQKTGYTAPAGTPASKFVIGSQVIPGARDVVINGDTRFDLELVRQ